MQAEPILHPRGSTRDTIHDLRNLFAIVASAKHLLEECPSPERRLVLLDAIERAAERGAERTTYLLSSIPPAERHETFDLNEKLAELEPMIRTLAGPPVKLALDRSSVPALVDLPPAAFEAAVIELVANARKAIGPRGSIVISTRTDPEEAQLIIADDGKGMRPPELGRALSTGREPEGSGIGLDRVRHFVRSAGGHLHLSSAPGRGTIVSMNLPTVPSITADEPTPTQGKSNIKENCHEER